MEKLTEQSLELSAEDDDFKSESCNPLQVVSGLTSQKDEDVVVLRTPEKMSANTQSVENQVP